ncbi:hypothetical protein DPMN_000223 [Dreissena polymorpha]|uniref:Uncharacterized protein n=1 Tax=Dreissena polymorpha TaxID=45954 RepID=A0A9D4MGY6_DREPO|nr:hypothetical protein DPMN_000223 [Dreissena polymorpha]
MAARGQGSNPYMAIEKPCEHSRSHNFCPIIMKLGQNIGFIDFSDEFENLAARWRGSFFYSTAKAEQTYFAIRGGKAQRVDAESAVEAASVCGGKSHFAAKLHICPPRHAEASRDPRHDAEAMRIFKSNSF